MTSEHENPWRVTVPFHQREPENPTGCVIEDADNRDGYIVIFGGTVSECERIASYRAKADSHDALTEQLARVTAALWGVRSGNAYGRPCWCMGPHAGGWHTPACEAAFAVAPTAGQEVGQ